VTRVLTAALCALLVAASAAAAEVRVEAQREGDGVVVEARAELDVSRRIAWSVLTDYERYPQFVPDLRSSHVLERSSARVVVEQRGVAGLFFYRFPMEVRLAVVEEPYDVVRCQAIAGNFRELTGTYRLESAGAHLRFVYSGKLVPDFPLPPLIGVPAVRASVERQFRGIVQEIERRAAGEGARE
jgi:ribosome-associated toxin RatA of RatAB toxin-antitoxin module